MPAKKKSTAKTTDTTDTPSTGGSRSTARTGEGEQQVAVDDGSGPEPSEVNSSLDSDRMKALLEEHRKMGARP
jgi:hypothetical protein